MNALRVGIVAVQGGFAAHAAVVRALAHEAIFVRAPTDLRGVDAIVLPGGESTVQLDLLSRLDLEAPLCEMIRAGCPVLATCAGLVLAAERVTHPRQRSFGFVDVAVRRNGWGRQVDSFEATSDDGRPLVFIRAPRIDEVGEDVEVLARFRGEPVLVRQHNVTCASFHPELTGDTSIHRTAFTSACAPTRASDSTQGASA